MRHLFLLFTLLCSSAKATWEVPAAGTLPPLPRMQIDRDSYAHTLEQSEKQCPDDDCHFWHQYIRAKFSTDKACALFSDLTHEKEFPLYPMVLLRALQACTSDKKTTESLLEQSKDYLKKVNPPKWVQRELSQAQANGALVLGTPDFFDLSLVASKESRNRKTRVSLIQMAVNEAVKQKSPRLEELQHELYRLAPRLAPTPDDWVAVGTDAFANHDYALATKAFEKVLASKKTGPTVMRLAFEDLKLSYKALQRRKEALKIAERLWQWDLVQLKKKHPAPDAARHALSSGLGYARFVWTEHNDKEALKILSQAEKILRKKVSVSEIYFVKGRIYEEELKDFPSLFWISKAVGSTNDPVQKNVYSWSFAWLNYKLGNLPRTKEFLENMLKTETDQGKRSQQTFWLAKTLERMHLNDDSQKMLAQLTSDDPLSYYALLAYRELKKPIPKVAEAETSTLSRMPKRIPASQKIDWNRFDWLIAVGELEYARALLDDEVALPDGIPDNWEDVLTHYAKADYYAPIFSRLFKLSAPEKERLLAVNADLLFPRKWGEFVDQASTRSGLAAEYIFSIMRQESSFDPLAISPANAYGLMQLLPTIAASLAKTLHLTVDGTLDLLDPQTNVTLGAQHLRNYWDGFDGQFVLTTASYNASQESVKNWVRTRYHGDPLIFIEDIPYEETRTYVKLVLRNFIHYQRLATPDHALPFPEWCLEGIQSSKD